MVFAPISYNGGFIALSFIISVIGALTTLELLRRVTSPRGLLNWLLLMSAAISMGGVSIWSMHYIGNRAIVLYGGLNGLQLSYGAGFTVLSLFMPILVLLLACIVVGSFERPTLWRFILAGTCGSAAICGMHYLGQLSIINYTSSYNIGHVVGSVIIAVVATNAALILFFWLRTQWDDAFWKQTVCAFILAGAVSGMHWTAATGTSYTLIPDEEGAPSGTWTAIVVAVISFIACVFFMGFAFEAGRRARTRRNRAQKVVLACATFDPEGRVMLTSDGMFPCREITNSFHERSFDDNFDTAHPVFLWIFRATFNWDAIRDLVHGMRGHLRATLSENMVDYSLIFREMFCVAAQALADTMSLPLEHLGVAYDQILETGKIRQQKSLSLSKSTNSTAAMFGRGQFLFLVKHVTKAETSHLTSTGFRFAPPSSVIGPIARAMQIERLEVKEHLDKMVRYYGCQSTFRPGVHIGFFGMRPNVQRGFNVMVNEKQTNSIPALQLPLSSLDDYQKAFVLSFSGKRVEDILKELRLPHTPRMDYDMQTFKANFHGAIVSLSQEINEPAFMDAILLPQLFQVTANSEPTNSSLEYLAPRAATLIILRSIIPIHNSSAQLQTSHLVYSPLSLFLTQQSIFSKAARTNFVRDTRKEFYAVFTSTISTHNLEPSTPSRWSPFKRRSLLSDATPPAWQLGKYMEDGSAKSNVGHETVVESGQGIPLADVATTPASRKGSSFSGIMLQKSVSVTIRDKDSVDAIRASAMSTSSMSTSMSENENEPLAAPIDDEATWTDICFKGILK